MARDDRLVREQVGQEVLPDRHQQVQPLHLVDRAHQLVQEPVPQRHTVPLTGEQLLELVDDSEQG